MQDIEISGWWLFSRGRHYFKGLAKSSSLPDTTGARFCRCSNSIRTEDAAAAEKAPVVDKANDAGPQPDEVSGKRGLTPNCEKELRRTADLLRFFANRIQTGEETQSVVADVTQQEKRIAAVCPD